MGAANRWWLLFAAPTSLVGVALAWALAHPDGPAPSSALRVMAVVLASVTLGVAALGWLGRADRRPAVADSELWRALTALAGAWTLIEVILVGMSAAEAQDVPLSGLTVAAFADFAGGITAGRIGVAVVGCVGVLTAVAAVTVRRGYLVPPSPALVLAAVALVARPITGHMSQQVLGSVLGAVHALAAAAWFGILAALALTLRSRGAWAVWLPRYSTVAWRCVWALAITGVVDAAVRLGSVAALVDTGYGQVVLAKAVALTALLALGWWWRRTWVGVAAAHRMSAEASLRRAVTEVIVMAVPFGLAAALATTA